MGDARSGDNAGKHTDAMPGAYRDLEHADAEAAAPEAGQAFLLEVDGEQFSVHVVVDAATGYTNSSYTWLSGPHPGYGFGMGGRPHPSAEDHRRCVRDFLAMVDPDTGFIGDD